MEQNNDNEMDAGAQQPDMYDLLCKVVFGEASAEESAQVEAALLGSAELQAEKVELEATVSLVRGAMGGESAAAGAGLPSVLSKGRMEAVLEAAAGPAGNVAPAGQLITNTPWYRSPVLGAAAATLLVGGGIWFAQGSQPGEDVDVAGGTAIRSTRDRAKFRGLDDTTIEDVTNGLEDMASAGLDPREKGVPGTNAAAAPSTGYFSEVLKSNETADSEEASGEARFGYAEPSQARTRAFSSGGAVPVDALTLPPVTDPAAPTGETLALYALGDVEDRYRGAADSVPPASKKATGVWYEAPGGGAPAAGAFLGVVTKPAGPGSPAPNLAISGPGSPVTLPFSATGSSVPASPAPAPSAKRSITSGAAPELKSLGYGSNLEIMAGDDEMYLGRGLGSSEKRRGAGGGGGRFEGHDFGLHVYPPHRNRHSVHEPRALPGERPRDMFFRFWGDNPFVISQRDALSTFAADVDTASFALAKRTLTEGRLPQRAQIRTEEFVNFLKPDLTCPTEDTFGINGELSPSPFGGAANRYLLRIGVRAKDVAPAERPPLALTFVVDTSGSMRENNRLELVKHALRLLVDQLDERDTISIVRFSTDASVVLEPTPATAGDLIETALFGLQPDGSTNAEAGLKLGYDMAERTIAEGTQTRVVFLSDGVANVGQTDQNRIADDVAAFSDRNVFLNTIGVGMGNHNDVFLEQLADKGEGVCDYVGNAADARRAIVDRFVGGFVTVAKDVKIQVEFDPKVVLRWRQLGYENRAVRDQDFRNDKVDAGEIGAGHQVTCLYEIEIASGDAKADRPVATARLRWKPVTPGEAVPTDEATERELAFAYRDIAAPSFREASRGFRRSALAAQLAECLRDSIHTAGDPVETLGKELAQLLSEDRHEDTATIADMTRRAIGMGLKTRPAPALTDADADHLDAYYDALIKSLGGAEPKVAPNKGAEKDTETARVEPRERESRIRDLLEGNRGEKPH